MIPKISVIVPCYGVEKYLDRCMESIVNQTLKELEIILVDDGSPDRVPEMCDEWAKKDSRVKVIHKKNEGLGFARNSGLEIATGEYVAFVDSDDFLDLEAYDIVYNIAITNNLDVCRFQRRRVDQNNNRIEVSFKKKTETYIGRSEVSLYMLNLVGHKPNDRIQSLESFSAWSGIMRRSIIERFHCRFPNEKVVASEDLLFQLEFLPHVERVFVLTNVFYNYYINTASITHNYNEAKRGRMILLLKMVRERLEKQYSYEDYYPHFCSQIMRIYRTILKFEARDDTPLKNRIQRIRSICSDDFLMEFYKSPYIKQYPIPMRLFIAMMKYNFPLFFITYYSIRKHY